MKTYFIWAHTGGSAGHGSIFITEIILQGLSMSSLPDIDSRSTAGLYRIL